MEQRQRSNNWLLVLLAFSVFLISVALVMFFWIIPSSSEGAELPASATSGEQRVFFSDMGMT